MKEKLKFEVSAGRRIIVGVGVLDDPATQFLINVLFACVEPRDNNK